jgi:hypothetical protein
MSPPLRNSISQSAWSPAIRWWRTIRPMIFGTLLVAILTMVLIFDILPEP